MNTTPDKKETWPISRYEGQFPDGEWVFFKEFEGTYLEASEEALTMQQQDQQGNAYRIWDSR